MRYMNIFLIVLAPSILLLILLNPVPAYSQDEQETPPEELLFQNIPMVTSGKRPQPVTEVSAAIAVITAEDIERYGARTIAEAIQYVPGLNVFGLSGINIRGVGAASRILLLTDGRRGNDIFTGGFEIGFERSVNKIERIEILKGPASSLYGTNAFAGIINVVTRDGASFQGLEVNARAGNFSTQNYTVQYGRQGNFDTYFALQGHFDEGPDLSGENDYTHAAEFFGKVGYGNLAFSAGYRPNRSGVPQLGGFPTPTSFIERDDGFLQTQFQKDYGDRWNVYAHGYAQREDLFFNDPTQDLDISDLRLEGEARANYEWSEKNSLTFGTEVRRDRTNNERSTGRETYKSNNTSIYAENHWRLHRKLILSTGARWDDNSVFGNSFNPHLGLIAQATNQTLIKIVAGRAFRGPDFLNLFTDIPVGAFIIRRNPELDAETVRSFEAEISHNLRPTIQIQANFYYNSLHDLITTVVSGNTATFANVGEATASGVEFGMNADLGRDVSVFGNYGFQNARDESTDVRLQLLPRHTLNAGISYRSDRGFVVGFYNKYVASRPAFDFINARPISLEDYLKSDLVLHLDVQQNWRISAAVYNVFGVKYESSFATPQRDVQAVIGLTYRR